MNKFSALGKTFKGSAFAEDEFEVVSISKAAYILSPHMPASQVNAKGMGPLVSCHHICLQCK